MIDESAFISMSSLLKRLRNQPGWLLFGLTIAVLGCIDTFDAGNTSGGRYLVVDAALSNAASGRTIKLGTAEQPFGVPLTTPITTAQVQIQATGGSPISLSGVGGIYALPTDFQFKTGTAYRLLIRLADGRQYQSATETMPAVVPIQKLHRSFDPQGYQSSVTTNKRYGAQNLLIDFQDPADQTNFYQWTYTLWEKQSVCASCDNGLYNNTTNKCVAAKTQMLFDYACQTDCWQIFRSISINVVTDALFNGKLLTDRLAGLLPYYQAGPCLVSVQQRNLTPGGYRYALILADQAQNTGGLADTPPAGLGGNVSNLTDATETVLGYFSLAGVDEILYWDDRSDVPASTEPLGLLGGRKFNPEPTNVYGNLRPPLAPCTPTDTRTPVKPAGWQN